MALTPTLIGAPLSDYKIMRFPSVIFAYCLVIALSSFGGCASDVANRYYGSVKYPPKAPSQVLVLNNRPSQDFDVIADFQSRNESPEDLRVKAAEIGADAVIVTVLGGHYKSSDHWADQDTGGSGNRIVGTAIIFKKSGAQRR